MMPRELNAPSTDANERPKARRAAWLFGPLVAAVLALGVAAVRSPAADGGPGEQGVSGEGGAGLSADRARLLAALSEQGVELDLAGGYASVDAHVLVRDELLEYLLVGPRGAAHESLFSSEVVPSALHAAMLLLGFAPGTNARWIPNPLGAEVGSRRPSFQVLNPEHAPGSPALYLYAGWREGDEVYFYRVEDLIADLSSGRAMRRHGFVYLGSKDLSPRGGQPGGFAADLLGNLISLVFFQEGLTLATGALAECLDQTIWTANPWLVPERGQPVLLVLSARPLPVPTEGILRSLPIHGEPREGDGQAGESDSPAEQEAPPPGGG